MKNSKTLSNQFHSLLSYIILGKHDNYLKLFILFLLINFFLSPENSFAGTEGSEFDDVVSKVKGLIEGGFGKVITLVSLAGSAIAGFNQKIATAFGAAIPGLICQFGPAIVEANVTALI